MNERPSIDSLRSRLAAPAQQEFNFLPVNTEVPAEEEPTIWASQSKQDLIKTMLFERFEAPKAQALWDAIDWTKVGYKEWTKTFKDLKAIKKLPLATRPAPADTDEVVIPADFMHGTYTVQYSDDDYRVIRIRRQPLDDEFMPGVALVGYQNGPSNTRDFRNFAHLLPSGVLKPWRRWSKPELVDALVAILSATYTPDNESGVYTTSEGAQVRITKSNLCPKCHQELTAPESENPYRAFGYGPVCGPNVGIQL